MPGVEPLPCSQYGRKSVFRKGSVARWQNNNEQGRLAESYTVQRLRNSWRRRGKARAHDHRKSKEISTRQFMQFHERRDLVREILSRSRRSAKTCSARSKFGDERKASTHRAGRHYRFTKQEPCARAGSRTGAQVR